MRVAVLGATGAVGRTMLRLLEERDFPATEVVALASARSEGQRLRFRNQDISVGAAEPGEWFHQVDLALVSAGSVVAREFLPPAAAAGTICIDNSSAFRLDPAVPLVIPEINPEAVATHSGIIANGNCTAIVALMALGPLHRAFGLRTLVTSSYQSVSGAGMKGLRELAEQVEKLHGQEELLAGGNDPGALPTGEVFGRTIAYNVVPRAERFDPQGSGYTTEELKMGAEVRKVLGIPNLVATATAVRVPVPVGHGVSIFGTFERPASAAEARSVLSTSAGVRLVDDPATDLFPTPLDSAGLDDVLVGRIRQGPDEHSLALFVCGDNLRKGAALNAVQIAELVVAKG